MNRFIILFLFSLGILSTCVFAVEVIPLNEGWNFHRGFQAPASEIVKVTLPHTWNAGDGMFGNADYYRGLCNYSRKLSVPAHYRGKRFFLKVMAAQTVADIFIDHHFVMQHKGGYTAFVAELTDFLVPGTESVLEIRVSNAQTMDVAPICGDFNMFGGLYRGVELLVTEDVCIEPAYYASSGVFFTQSDVSEKKAHLKIEALLSARETTVTGCEVEFRLYDKEKFNAYLKEEIEVSMRLEPGVLVLYAVAEKERPNHVTILEIYADEAAYKSHIATPHFKKYKEGTLDMVQMLELIDATPLIPGLKMK